MQETEYSGKKLQEFFAAFTEGEIEQMMDARLKELESMGHTFVRRVHKIGRNDKCPCASGKKFKKCCLNKVAYY